MTDTPIDPTNTFLFFYRGQHYHTFEGFLNASREWVQKPLNKEDFLEIWNHIGKDIYLNMEIYTPLVKTNNDVYGKTEMLLCTALEILIEEFQVTKVEE